MHSQHYNKTLKGGELVASNIGDDQFLTGAALCDAKMKLGVMTEVGMEATMQLQGNKKGQAGVFIRQAYLKGKELLDEKALLDSIRDNLAKKNQERAQGMPKGHGRLKKRKKRVVVESDAEDEQSDAPVRQLDGGVKGRGKGKGKRSRLPRSAEKRQAKSLAFSNMLRQMVV